MFINWETAVTQDGCIQVTVSFLFVSILVMHDCTLPPIGTLATRVNVSFAKNGI